ncbi:hypothetical protein TTRE_0000132901 [Trichuris trichiura]|uniref:Transmembrane protein n=1 Tax=Trichuris trichiura TaxID=36087 RepID=A0A077YYZ7_TRITR|nr:hypothetical protein TTRE_0000132901 [Trichuris trichiura]
MIVLGADLSVRRPFRIELTSTTVQKRCQHDADNPYVVPKNRFVRLWRRFLLRHPYFGLGCIVGASSLFLFSPYIGHTLKAFTMSKEEYNAYREQIYQRNVNRGRYGEGLSILSYTFDLFSKETIEKEKEMHERMFRQYREEAEKKRRAKEAQKDST